MFPDVSGCFGRGCRRSWLLTMTRVGQVLSHIFQLYAWVWAFEKWAAASWSFSLENSGTNGWNFPSHETNWFRGFSFWKEWCSNRLPAVRVFTECLMDLFSLVVFLVLHAAVSGSMWRGGVPGLGSMNQSNKASVTLQVMTRCIWIL